MMTKSLPRRGFLAAAAAGATLAALAALVALPGPTAAAAPMLPLCQPPVAGTWWVGEDCQMTGDRTAPGDVVVLEDVTLRLAASSSLDVDFKTHRLRVLQGARLVIEPGARVH